VDDVTLANRSVVLNFNEKDEDNNQEESESAQEEYPKLEEKAASQAMDKGTPLQSPQQNNFMGNEAVEEQEKAELQKTDPLQRMNSHTPQSSSQIEIQTTDNV
jgi:hypothetical protein